MNMRLNAIGKGILAALAAAVPLALVTAADAAKGIPEGKENTIVIVQNVGNAPADIALDIYTPAGVLVPAASRVSIDVVPGGTTQFPQAVNDGLVAGFRGVGVISADQPVNALEVRDILRPTATEAKSYSLANATATGGHTLAMPILFNELLTADWNSRISLVNVGSTTACVNMTYYLTSGAGGTIADNGPGCLGGTGYTLNAGAQITFSPEPGDMPFPNSTFNNQLAGLAEVRNAEASNKIAAIVDVYRSDGNRLFGSYNAIVYDPDNPSSDDVGTDIAAPIAMKSTSGFYTVIGVMNLGPAATVNIEYSGNLADGTGAATSVTVNLGSVDTAGFHSTYSAGTNVQTGFIGSARVKSSSPLAVVVIRGKQTSAGSGVNEAAYAAVNGVPTDRATTEWRAPLFFRRFSPGGPGTFGFNSWVQVQVADGTTSQVKLRYVGDPTSGCPVGPFEATHTVSGSKVFLANANSDNGFPAGNSPNCFFGGLNVTSMDGKDLIVITQVGADKFPGGDSEGVTNSFPGN